MGNAVIVDAVRSPMGKGKPTGALADVHPVDLLAQVFIRLLERSGVEPGSVDDVLIGCVGQNGEQSATPGRQAWLAAGFPTHVQAVSIERKCGSGQQAVDFAAWGIQAGVYDIAIAGGVESMSRVPMGSNRVGMDPFGPGVHERFPHLVPQGVSAELVAAKWSLSRTQLDEYAAQSHVRAEACRTSGGFDAEIVTITTPHGDVAIDETIRPGTTVGHLTNLVPAFADEKYRDVYPEFDWKVTAGNSSQLTDGASALLVMSEERAAALGVRKRARILASAVCGDDPTPDAHWAHPGDEKGARTREARRQRHRCRGGERGIRLRTAGMAGRVRHPGRTGQSPRGCDRSGPPTRRVGRTPDDDAHQPPRANRRPVRLANDVRSRRHG